MTEERWQRVREVFEQAVACPPDERAAILVKECAQDAELRAEVDSLLSHHAEASPDFLRPCQPVPQPPGGEEHHDARIGQRIGSYEITGLISSGGMGVVYRAVQDRPHRTVALKVMRAGLTSKKALQRFKYEAELLGRLQHPNIAQVYEAGMHQDGDRERILGPASEVPYFAMEYIPDARSITDYADACELSTRQRLELFAQVCDAVHHGHQKGIIHRDLKPANILVANAEGSGFLLGVQGSESVAKRDEQSAIRNPKSAIPKIIDFGVARCTDADLAVTTMRTDVGELIGTLPYMSPEQCEGDPKALDTRSDVYALGVVMYELLCGRLPYETGGGSWMRVARTICETPPVRPSTIDRKLRGDLEIIVLKALAKDREQRYASAAAMADDIRRYLSGEPVSARRATGWMRFSRWIARHPVATTSVIGCVAVAFLTLVLTGLSIWTTMHRPYDVELSKDRRQARLVAVTGYTIHEWTPESPTQIGSARFVHIPEPLAGAGPAVLLSYSASGPSSELHGLVAYPAMGDRDQPIWSRKVELDEMPELFITEGIIPESGGTRILLVVDIFDQSPGEEVVAQHLFGGGTLTIFRVYGLDGQVLFQFCYDGQAHGQDSAYWMADEGLLIFAGVNGEKIAQERGCVTCEIDHPRIVFAVRPEYGVIHREFLATGPDWGTVQPAWHFAVEPMELLAAHSYLALARPFRRSDPRRSVLLNVCFPLDDEESACFDWELNKDGEIIGAARPNNQYAIDEDKMQLPDPEEFYLGELRPIIEEAKEPPSPQPPP